MCYVLYHAYNAIVLRVSVLIDQVFLAQPISDVLRVAACVRGGLGNGSCMGIMLAEGRVHRSRL